MLFPIPLSLSSISAVSFFCASSTRGLMARKDRWILVLSGDEGGRSSSKVL